MKILHVSNLNENLNILDVCEMYGLQGIHQDLVSWFSTSIGTHKMQFRRWMESESVGQESE